jgi:SGNH domain-containing protein
VTGRTPRSAGRHATGSAAALLLAAALGAGGMAFAATDREQTGAAPTALPAVARAVAAARRGAPIPRPLRPPIATIKLFPREYRLPPACIGHDSSPRVRSRVCRVGDASSKKLVVLLGDSHAFMWLPAVMELAQRDDLALVPLLRLGCTPGKWMTSRGSSACRAWFRWGVREIRRLRPYATLLGGSVGEDQSGDTRAAVSGMIAAARLLRPLAPLEVIGDPESLVADPVPCLTSPRSSMATCMTTWPAAALAPYDTVARGVKRLGVGFLATRGFVCHQRQCPAAVGHTIVWMDNNHLTGWYSAELAPAFRAAFLRAKPR